MLLPSLSFRQTFDRSKTAEKVPTSPERKPTASTLLPFPPPPPRRPRARQARLARGMEHAILRRKEQALMAEAAESCRRRHRSVGPMSVADESSDFAERRGVR